MGTIVKVKCTSCGYEEELRLGCGIRDNRLEQVSEYFGDKQKEEINRLVKKNITAYTWNYRRGIGNCEHCKRLKEIPVLLVLSENGERKIIKGDCDCGNHVTVLLDWESEEILCPRCNHILFREETGYWD